MRRRLADRVAALLVAAAAFLALPAAAQNVDMQLVLAVDVSGSVNRARFELQRDGYAAAFRHPRVLAAVRSGAARAIAVTMVQWTGPGLQVQAVKWTRVWDGGSAEDLSAAIDRMPRELFSGGTSISGVIDYAVPLFGESPFKAARRVIDISGDGANNRGRPAHLARNVAIAAGIGINGLPILGLEADLDRYYQENVIGGPGAFMIVAKSYDTFADAILRKLIAEIAGTAPVLAGR